MKLPKEILTASVAEKLSTIEQIWNSISTDDNNLEVPEAHKKEANRRLQNMTDKNSLTFEQLKNLMVERYS